MSKKLQLLKKNISKSSLGKYKKSGYSLCKVKPLYVKTSLLKKIKFYITDPRSNLIVFFEAFCLEISNFTKEVP